MKEVHLSYRGDVDLHLPVTSFLSEILSGPSVHTGTQVHPPQDGRPALERNRNKQIKKQKVCVENWLQHQCESKRHIVIYNDFKLCFVRPK